VTYVKTAAVREFPTIPAATVIALNVRRSPKSVGLKGRKLICSMLDIFTLFLQIKSHSDLICLDELNTVIYQNQKVCYNILFRSVSETLQELCADKKYLGAKIEFTSILKNCVVGLPTGGISF